MCPCSSLEHWSTGALEHWLTEHGMMKKGAQKDAKGIWIIGWLVSSRAHFAAHF